MAAEHLARLFEEDAEQLLVRPPARGLAAGCAAEPAALAWRWPHAITSAAAASAFIAVAVSTTVASLERCITGVCALS